jgi:hypothetical protein
LKNISFETIKAQNRSLDNKKLHPSFLDRFQRLGYSLMKSAKADFIQYFLLSLEMTSPSKDWYGSKVFAWAYGTSRETRLRSGRKGPEPFQGTLLPCKHL